MAVAILSPGVIAVGERKGFYCACGRRWRTGILGPARGFDFGLSGPVGGSGFFPNGHKVLARVHNLARLVDNGNALIDHVGMWIERGEEATRQTGY
jgi:hypothetical protein